MNSTWSLKTESSNTILKPWENRIPLLVYPGYWTLVRPDEEPLIDCVQIFERNELGAWNCLYRGEIYVTDYHMRSEGSSLGPKRVAKIDSKVEDPKPPIIVHTKSRRGRKRGACRSARNSDALYCDACGNKYASKNALERHMIRSHLIPASPNLDTDVPSTSDVGNRFSWELMQRDLDQLNKTGRKVDKKCSICSKRFDRKGDLKRHMIEHILNAERANADSNDGFYCCPYCDRRFDRVDALKADLREHMNLTSYHCTVCNKSFSDSSNFSKHKKVHGLSAMQCDVCRRKFNTLKMMEAHMLHHQTAPPVRCDYCDKTFCFESQLRKHSKAAHSVHWYDGSAIRPTRGHSSNPKQYGCGACGERFASLRDKWTHAWRSHGIRRALADCWQCAARFRIVSELRVHLSQIHSQIYTCKQVRERQQPPRETTHMRVIHDTSF